MTSAWLCLAACSDPRPPTGPGQDASVDAPPLPDLTVNALRTQVDLAIEEAYFPPHACELDPDEDCVAAPGVRRLLRFSVETPNIGTADVFVGPPQASNPAFVYSACHDHFHFIGYAEYTLIDPAGGQVLLGRKQAFCLLDTIRVIDAPEVPTSPRYECNFQGIQRGWSDVYESSLPCQYLDITDLPDGPYVLRIHVNHAGILAESNHDNNVAEIPVRIGDSALLTPTEPCPGIDHYALAQPHRECGWAHAGTWDCLPGALVRIGCSDACGLGSCTGEPMLRVCASGSTSNCSAAASLGRSMGECGSACPYVGNIVCPASGRVDAYVAARRPGQAFTCNLALSSSP